MIFYILLGFLIGFLVSFALMHSIYQKEDGMIIFEENGRKTVDLHISEDKLKERNGSILNFRFYMTDKIY